MMEEVGVSGKEEYPYFSNSRLRASTALLVSLDSAASSGGVGGRARLAKYDALAGSWEFSLARR
jgi:hypothetical protein